MGDRQDVEWFFWVFKNSMESGNCPNDRLWLQFAGCRSVVGWLPAARGEPRGGVRGARAQAQRGVEGVAFSGDTQGPGLHAPQGWPLPLPPILKGDGYDCSLNSCVRNDRNRLLIESPKSRRCPWPLSFPPIFEMGMFVLQIFLLQKR